jgi:hypothetical protein
MEVVSMKKTIFVVGLLFFSSFLINPQETKKEAKESLIKILDEMSKQGIKIEGEVDTESSKDAPGRIIVLLGRIVAGEDEEPPYEGDFTVTIEQDGAMVIEGGDEESKIKIFKKGDRIIKRKTWIKKQTTIGSFAQEICTLVDMNALKKVMKEADIEKIREKKRNGTEFRVIFASLPEEFLEPSSGKFTCEIDEIEIEFWIDKKTKKLRKMEVVIEKTFTIHEISDVEGSELTVAYILNFTRIKKDIKAKIPDEIRKLLNK